MDFNIGDEVEIIYDGEYSITRIGSIGIITKISRGSAKIKFHTITSTYQEYVGDSFDIDTLHIKLLKPLPKEERIIKKINSIYLRQQKRGIIHV